MMLMPVAFVIIELEEWPFAINPISLRCAIFGRCLVSGNGPWLPRSGRLRLGVRAYRK